MSSAEFVPVWIRFELDTSPCWRWLSTCPARQMIGYFKVIWKRGIAASISIFFHQCCFSGVHLSFVLFIWLGLGAAYGVCAAPSLYSDTSPFSLEPYEPSQRVSQSADIALSWCGCRNTCTPLEKYVTSWNAIGIMYPLKFVRGEYCPEGGIERWCVGKWGRSGRPHRLQHRHPTDPPLICFCKRK